MFLNATLHALKLNVVVHFAKKMLFAEYGSVHIVKA